MKKVLFFLLLLLTVNCSKNDPSESCNCTIKGTKQISFDNGVTWQYNGMDGRTGMKFPCNYDGIYTNQSTTDNVMYRIFWECQD